MISVIADSERRPLGRLFFFVRLLRLKEAQWIRFERTNLWRNALASQGAADSESSNREHLRNAYMQFRMKAGTLANEIARSLPEFTVHDATHLDALWEMADVICGEDYPLNPAEAFVLGGAFLVHDLGMGVAAYPGGVDQLRNSDLWHDSVTNRLRSALGREPTEAERASPPDAVEQEVLRQVLRQLHAQHAEQLGLIEWNDDGLRHRLIEDDKLRAAYGPIIGKIAHSHWWPVEEIPKKLPHQLGAVSGFPNTWTVDPIKVACIMRVADASHLDDRRAPAFLKALRRPDGLAKSHWQFQEKLYQPSRQGDRLIFSAKSAFEIAESDAWWVCFDAMQMVDRELRFSDGLLADTARPRFATKGVANAEDPSMLSRFIATAGWEPVDAKIRVGSVSRLVSTLGGAQLYGDRPLAALRELIQNACDAVRARRMHEGRQNTWGSVVVRHTTSGSDSWIEVEDTGIGMSQAVLTGPFLDFGSSYWGSELMHLELPGLDAKGFASTGKFGIGFFSVFMLGDEVSVITRRPSVAAADTIVLEFRGLAGSRPLLRKALPTEQLLEGGTKVRVKLRDEKVENALLESAQTSKRQSLLRQCAYLCPALDVDLFAEEAGKKKQAIGANDWLRMDFMSLIGRVSGIYSKLPSLAPSLEAIQENAEILYDAAGRPIGRVCIYRQRLLRTSEGYMSSSRLGVVAVGGLRASAMFGISGVLLGQPQTAARDSAIPLVEPADFAEWSERQAQKLIGIGLTDAQLVEHASVVRTCGGKTGDLPVAFSAGRHMTAKEIEERMHEEEVVLVQDAELSTDYRGDSAELFDDVYSVDVGRLAILHSDYDDPRFFSWPERVDDIGEWGNRSYHSRTLEGLVIESVAKSWGASLSDVLRSAEFTTDADDILRAVGMLRDHPYTVPVDVLTKPTKKARTRRRK